MATSVVDPSRVLQGPFRVALKKREEDFQCRMSCIESLCRLGGLGGHDGLGVGHDGPPAIVASSIVYNRANTYLLL